MTVTAMKMRKLGSNDRSQGLSLVSPSITLTLLKLKSYIFTSISP